MALLEYVGCAYEARIAGGREESDGAIDVGDRDDRDSPRNQQWWLNALSGALVQRLGREPLAAVFP